MNWILTSSSRGSAPAVFFLAMFFRPYDGRIFSERAGEVKGELNLPADISKGEKFTAPAAMRARKFFYGVPNALARQCIPSNLL